MIKDRTGTTGEGVAPPPTGKVFTGIESLSIVRGQGAYCWDESGKRYVDYICGYGPIVLGHADAEVNEAVVERLNSGILFPSGSPLIDELSATLHRLFPDSDRFHLAKTGSEAVAAAVRLARAFTGRAKVIRCGFHGWHDPFIIPYVSWHKYEIDISRTRPVSGVPHEPSHPLVLTWDGRSLQQLAEIYLKNRGQVAAMVLDPVQLREPVADNLSYICDLTRREGALLVLDEAKTGFRVSLRGVQGLYGTRVDLTILSKAIANGFPLAVVMGRAEIFDRAKNTKLKGTFNTELASVAAALTTISIMERPDSVPKLNQLGQQMIDGLNEVFVRTGMSDSIRAVAYRWPCMPYIWFTGRPERATRLKALFYQRLTERGVLMLPNHMNYICLSHTMQDVGKTVQHIEDILSNDLSSL
jgi:glutamate-1-semialdehyde 2,1-aminomutase